MNPDVTATIITGVVGGATVAVPTVLILAYRFGVLSEKVEGLLRKVQRLEGLHFSDK